MSPRHVLTVSFALSGLLPLAPPPAAAETADTTAHPSLRPERLVLIAAVPTALAVRETAYRRARWWRDAPVRFRVEEDLTGSLGSDKLMHVFATAATARTLAAGLVWSGMPERDAALAGALGAWAFLSYLEVLDGFGPHWGFSPSDALANTLGAAFVYGQTRSPTLAAFDLRLAYRPSGQGGRRLTADHAGMTWWVAANPRALGAGTPSWLGVALGYGARPGPDGRLTEAEVLVGLDLDLRGLPLDHPLWNALTEVLRHVRLPAPGVRLAPRPTVLPLAY